MNANPYEVCWRVDKDGRPMSLYITETVVANSNGYVLDEIPDTYERVTIKTSQGARLVEKLSNDLNGNQFYVDYGNGIVYFSPEVAGVSVTITYYGRGFKKITSLRVQNIMFNKGTLSNEDIDNIIAQLEAMKQ